MPPPVRPAQRLKDCIPSDDGMGMKRMTKGKNLQGLGGVYHDRPPVVQHQLGDGIESALKAYIAFPLDGHYIAFVESIPLSDRDERRAKEAQACPRRCAAAGHPIPMGKAVAILLPADAAKPAIFREGCCSCWFFPQRCAASSRLVRAECTEPEKGNRLAPARRSNKIKETA